MSRETIYEIRVLPGRHRTHLHLLEISWNPNGSSNPRIVAAESVPDAHAADVALRFLGLAQAGIRNWRRAQALEDPLPGV